MMVIYYGGKTIQECTKEELIDCIEIMVKRDNVQIDSQENEYRDEILRLSKIVSGIKNVMEGAK